MASNMILECDSSDIEDDNSSFSSCGSFLPSWEFCRVGRKATKEGGNDVDEGSDPGEAHSIVVEGYQFEPSTDGDTDSEDGDPTEDIRRLFSTDWCECDHCECMGTIKESRAKSETQS